MISYHFLKFAWNCQELKGMGFTRWKNTPTTQRWPKKSLRNLKECDCLSDAAVGLEVWSNVVHVSQNLVQEDRHPMASKGLVSQAQDLAIGWCWHWWDLTIWWHAGQQRCDLKGWSWSYLSQSAKQEHQMRIKGSTQTQSVCDGSSTLARISCGHSELEITEDLP